MPIKDKKRYNNYMRDYMRRKADKDKIDLNDPDLKKALELVKSKTNDPLTGEQDPVIKVIENATKYAPLIQKFIEGFSEAAKSYQARHPQAQPQVQKIKPPEGWTGMSPLQRMTYKYSRPEWYAAGERYEAYVNGLDSIEPEPAYQPPTSRQPQQSQERFQTPEPKSMEELSHKYPEPPLVTNNEQSEQVQPEPEQEKIEEAGDQEMGEQLKNALRQDNAKYINYAVEAINKMTDKEYTEKLNHMDELIAKSKPMLFLLPVSVSEMLKNTSSDELISIFKEKCETKYEIAVMLDKIDLIRTKFDEIKKEL